MRGKTRYDLAAAAEPSPLPRKTYVLGLGRVRIEAGETVELAAVPAISFHLRSIHVPPRLLRKSRIDDLSQARHIHVGKTLETVDASLVEAGHPVAMRVTSTSRSSQYFSAALLGEPVERSGR